MTCVKISCWDRRQTVNLVSAGGLVEQSNAAKNNAVDKLAGSAAGRLAGSLAGWLLMLLVAGWPAGCWLTGWLAAGLLLLLLLAGSVTGLLCYGCWRLAGWMLLFARWLPDCCWLAALGWLTLADWPELLWLLPEWLTWLS